MSSNAIALAELVFAYKNGPAILRIPSLQIPTGRRVFLHGPSGSGKTTLLSLISGVLTAQQGSVEVLGRNLAKLSPGARDTLRGSEIGYIFQGFNLIPYLTVRENIALPCDLHPARRQRITASTTAEEVRRIATRLDLHAHLDAPVTHLSTGQQQRVAIARAIIGSPALVIADEPTSSLDTDRRDAFLDLLTEVTAEARATLLFVSHDRSLATHFDETLSLATINEAAQTSPTEAA
jgi:putative ABC transport system ATP-binding protein